MTDEASERNEHSALLRDRGDNIPHYYIVSNHVYTTRFIQTEFPSHYYLVSIATMKPSSCNVSQCMFVLAIVAATVCIWIISPFQHAHKKIGEMVEAGNSSTFHGWRRNMTSDSITANNNEIWDSDFQFIQCNTGNSTSAEMCCNGLTSNCDMRVNKILFATMHNAMSTRDDNFLAPDHELSLEKALIAGFRAFMLDICDCNDSVFSFLPEKLDEAMSRINGNAIDLQFCHGTCLAGTRDISTVFQHMVNFLNAYKGEVILIDFQFPDTPAERDLQYLSVLYTMMRSVDGFTDMMYIHNQAESKWPWMRKLVAQNKVSRCPSSGLSTVLA